MCFFKSRFQWSARSRGQGFAEYAIILAFVSVAAMVSITILEPAVGDVFSRLVGRQEISPPTLANYQAPPTPTVDPNATPAITNTPNPNETATPDGSGGGTATPTDEPIITNTPTALPQVCTTYSSGDTPTNLPNNTDYITSEITADAGNGSIYDVNVTIDMDHNWVGDLIFTLTGPSGQAVTLLNQPGLPGSSYGCDGKDISVTLDDDAALPVEDQCNNDEPTIDGTFSPNSPLNVFDSLSSTGVWTLRIDDEYTSDDDGRLNSWDLEICTGGGQAPTATPIPQPTSTALPAANNICDVGTISQSSTAYGGNASLACDGDRDGNFNNGSVTHTNSENEAWWEIDLGRIYVLQQIKLFNRTDCCLDRLSNFYILVSDNPFQSTDLDTTINQPGVDSYYFDGNVDAFAYAFSLQSARYVRIQLTGSDPLSLAEVEIFGSLWVPGACEAIVDMYYVFDVSGSMGWNFDGSSTKIEAARDAVINLNNTIADDNVNHRVGFTTFTTNGSYSSGGKTYYPIQLQSVPLNSDITTTNATVASWQAQAGTPTGAALNEARLTMIDDWNPLRIPIIVLVSDGVPTIDQTERGYSDSNVQGVTIYNNNGDPKTANQVENSGSGNPKAGVVVAEVMREAQELMSALPNATMHSIAIGGTGFNTEVLQYVADVGGGQYFNATNSTELSNQLVSIFNSASCDNDS